MRANDGNEGRKSNLCFEKAAPPNSYAIGNAYTVFWAQFNFLRIGPLLFCDEQALLVQMVMPAPKSGNPVTSRNETLLLYFRLNGLIAVIEPPSALVIRDRAAQVNKWPLGGIGMDIIRVLAYGGDENARN